MIAAKPVSRLTQADGARLHWAHNAVLGAKHNRCCAYFNFGMKDRRFTDAERDLKAAEAAFADLVSEMVCDETE
jgi:hypothetical protein